LAVKFVGTKSYLRKVLQKNRGGETVTKKQWGIKCHKKTVGDALDCGVHLHNVAPLPSHVDVVDVGGKRDACGLVVRV